MIDFSELSPPYKTIVADPPWRYRTDRVSHMSTANKEWTSPDPNKRYSGLSDEEIAAMPVESLAGPNCHLYLWATCPKLEEAFGIMRSWGFTYKSLITWRKEGTLGMGVYFRVDTEHVLFGVRGSLPIPPADRQRNWLAAAKTGHSIKPPAFMDMVERVSPEPRAELFARAPRLGWDSWGHGYESHPSSPPVGTQE
jgi:N6-adenosine-specific RNA methylase IME4